MRTVAVVLASLVCINHASVDDMLSQGVDEAVPTGVAEIRAPLGEVVVADVARKPDKAAPSLWHNPDVQRVLMLLCVIGFGKLLQSRFPNKDAGAIQKMLLQFLVPATLFKGLSKEKIESSHLIYLQGGFLLVLARIVASVIVSYAAFGTSTGSERAALRRTAIFEISTMASALSVLPFVKEFVSEGYVGVGGMVDLPMKLYMLLAMPALLRKFGEQSGDATSSTQGGMNVKAILLQLSTDPITLSLVFGIVTAMLTDGKGTGALGFVGKALDTLAGAQSPVLFLLIGLKLKFESSTPIFSIVLLLGTQGVLLIMLRLALLIVQPGAEVMKFMILFAQGAPSVVGMGVITAAATQGVKGYSTDFAFDIVGLAFPISSFMQCFAGILGDSYPSAMGYVGVALVSIAAVLRVIFSNRFLEMDKDELLEAVEPAGKYGIELKPSFTK
eukprot:TRINITY_DN1721_c0_g1_i2.p1 TRINITY_DN1721_c0_g1~~TRINITY_DN1721_c0_g1_i2.p1  ORF type:complete len:444 (-),score=76.58 TRINITY_DN1721_c0_g1_i2:320-1651(-)